MSPLLRNKGNLSGRDQHKILLFYIYTNSPTEKLKKLKTQLYPCQDEMERETCYFLKSVSFQS